MKNHICAFCNYSSDRLIDLDRHKLSKKHMKNVNDATTVNTQLTGVNPKLPLEKSVTTDNIITQVISTEIKPVHLCVNCNTTFSHKSGLSRHRKKCIIENNKDVEKLKMEIDMEKLKNQHLQEKLELMNSFKNIAENTAETSRTSCSALNYIMKNYSNAPYIQEFTKFELLKEGNEDYSVAEIVIHKYNYNELCTYIGDIIVGEYKTKNPNQQTLWSSDVNRLAYIIREITTNNKAEWFTDKGGIKTAKYIVQPILNHINEDLDKYYMDKLEDLDNEECEESNKTLIRNNLIVVRNIIKTIKTNQLNDEIVKYIAKFMYLDRKNSNNMITYTGEILDEVD